MVMYEDSPHHDIQNIPLCEDHCTRSSSRYSNIPLAKRKHNIYVHTIYVSFTIVIPMWDLQTSKNFDSWFYSFDKWTWLCVIQYLVWWLILRYCYTYDIYKISLTETMLTFISLCRFRIMSISQDIFGNFVSKQAYLNMSNLYQCLDIRNILYDCKSAMLLPILYGYLVSYDNQNMISKPDNHVCIVRNI